MKNPFHYVYILISESDNNRHYTGITNILEARLQAHNAGQVPHTAKYQPWKIETAIAFRSRVKAASFEDVPYSFFNPVPISDNMMTWR